MRTPPGRRAGSGIHEKLYRPLPRPIPCPNWDIGSHSSSVFSFAGLETGCGSWLSPRSHAIQGLARAPTHGYRAWEEPYRSRYTVNTLTHPLVVSTFLLHQSSGCDQGRPLVGLSIGFAIFTTCTSRWRTWFSNHAHRDALGLRNDQNAPRLVH